MPETTALDERVRELQQDVNDLRAEVEHINIILGLIGHLAGEGRSSTSPAVGHRRSDAGV